jgi:cobalamin biosynthesis protein CobT
MLEGFNFSHEGENYQKLKRAEKLFEQNRFDEAEKIYGGISTQKYREALTIDRSVNLYAGKQYGKVTELYEKGDKENLNSEYLFNIGNSYKFNGDTSPKVEDRILNYKKALQAYKYAMLKNGDMNIKKNYEITSKLLKKIENSNNQNKDNSDNNDNSKKQGENQNNDKNKQEQTTSQNYNKNEKSQNNKNSNSSGENKSDQSNEQQNNENNKNSDAPSKNNTNQDMNSSPESAKESRAGNSNEENSKDSQRLEELMYHLKDIENLEKDGLKNNQKILNQNFDISDNSKNW